MALAEVAALRREDIMSCGFMGGVVTTGAAFVLAEGTGPTGLLIGFLVGYFSTALSMTGWLAWKRGKENG